jgi:hypothetical protein
MKLAMQMVGTKKNVTDVDNLMKTDKPKGTLLIKRLIRDDVLTVAIEVFSPVDGQDQDARSNRAPKLGALKFVQPSSI